MKLFYKINASLRKLQDLLTIKFLGSNSDKYVLCTPWPIFNARIGWAATIYSNGCHESIDNRRTASKSNRKQAEEKAIRSSKSKKNVWRGMAYIMILIAVGYEYYHLDEWKLTYNHIFKSFFVSFRFIRIVLKII